jgi:hypothetical protein
MGTTRLGSQIETGSKEVAVSGGSVALTTVTFPIPFKSIPVVLVVPHLGDEDATITTSSITIYGFSFTVSGSNLPDDNVEFEYAAHEKT